MWASSSKQPTRLLFASVVRLHGDRIMDCGVPKIRSVSAFGVLGDKRAYRHTEIQVRLAGQI